MNKLLLTQLPISYADSINFENSGTTFQLKMLNTEHQLVILLKNILTLNFSKDSLNSNEDWVDIIDITHEYRKLTDKDLGKYSFSLKNVDGLPPSHIVTFYGNTVIEIICEEIEIQSHSP